jgi:hypothetical protein
MKLKQLQQDRIEKIIREEMKNMKEGWVRADELKKSSSLNERNLFEEGSPLEQDLSPDALVSSLEQSAMDSAQACLVGLDQELLNHLASVLQSHGLLPSGAGAAAVSDMLEDFDETTMVDAQMECASTITNALQKYIEEMAVLAAGVYSGHE